MSNGKKFDTAIIGLGLTGLSCARYLHRQGEKLVVVDTRANPPDYVTLLTEFPDIPVYTEGLHVNILQQAHRVVTSPGLNPNHPGLKHIRATGIPVISDMDILFENITVPVVAITGTNGKSSVTMMLAMLAKEAGKKVLVGGNIGQPVLDLLSQDIATCDFLILELSSYQLALAKHLPTRAAVILNISSDHLDWHENNDNYVRAKQKIYAACEMPVINHDMRALVSNKHKNVITYGLSKPSPGTFSLKTENKICHMYYGMKKMMTKKKLKIHGRHNHSNALSAMALGLAMGLPMSDMVKGLAKFQGLPHRCQPLGLQKGVYWYNDSKCSEIYKV